MDKAIKTMTLLLHIQGYCKEIEDTLNKIKHNKKKFDDDFIIRNSLAMDLLQIGELAKRLDDSYISDTKGKIEWNKIMRIKK